MRNRDCFSNPNGENYDPDKVAREKETKSILTRVARITRSSLSFHFNPGGPAVPGDATAFFERDGSYVYVRSDRPGEWYARTAEGPKDYTGGSNNWTEENNLPTTVEWLLRTAHVRF